MIRSTRHLMGLDNIPQISYHPQAKLIKMNEFYYDFSGRLVESHRAEDLLSEGVVDDVQDITGAVLDASGWVHLGIDVVSGVLDFVPGLQGVAIGIDAVHALLYFGEAMLPGKTEEEQDDLIAAGFLTGAFALIPGATALVAPLKLVMKTAKRTPVDPSTLIKMHDSLKLLKNVSNKIVEAARKIQDSDFGRKFFSGKFTLEAFVRFIKSMEERFFKYINRKLKYVQPRTPDGKILKDVVLRWDRRKNSFTARRNIKKNWDGRSSAKSRATQGKVDGKVSVKRSKAIEFDPRRDFDKFRADKAKGATVSTSLKNLPSLLKNRAIDKLPITFGRLLKTIVTRYKGVISGTVGSYLLIWGDDNSDAYLGAGLVVGPLAVSRVRKLFAKKGKNIAKQPSSDKLMDKPLRVNVYENVTRLGRILNPRKVVTLDLSKSEQLEKAVVEYPKSIVTVMAQNKSIARVAKYIYDADPGQAENAQEVEEKIHVNAVGQVLPEGKKIEHIMLVDERDGEAFQEFSAMVGQTQKKSETNGQEQGDEKTEGDKFSFSYIRAGDREKVTTTGEEVRFEELGLNNSLEGATYYRRTSEQGPKVFAVKNEEGNQEPGVYYYRNGRWYKYNTSVITQ